MRNQWRLICNTLWPEPDPEHSQLPPSEPGLFKHTHFALSYKHEAVKTCIRNNKFHFHHQSAVTLATVADQFLQRYPEAIIIPLPSSKNRERIRGYQHLLNILQHSQYRQQVRINWLMKRTNTPSQSQVSKAVRLQQQVGTYKCNQQAVRQAPRTVVLFDDVVTTESTMAAARATLAPHLPPDCKLICFALAH